MAFDQTTRNRLQRFVNSAREILSDEFTRQLQAVYGMDPKQGTVADISSLTHLNNSQRQTAHILRETLEHYLATTPGKSDKDRVKQVLSRIVREQAFTVLNRLAALRMAEARDFLLESIGKGQSSKGFQLYRQLAGTSHGETGDAYRNYLFSLFDEFSIDLAVLFDRYSTQGRLFPRESALLELLAEINHHEIEELWAEDETIGWIYQYFNSQEERKKMRAESQAPRNSRELAVRNQFFTPRYVVEFLTDNTLGRIWYEMTQGNTALIDSCSYLVRRPNEIFLKPDEQSPETGSVESESLSQDELLKQPVYIPYRKLKDPRSIHMLDPACGSMHFGLYAFDLYEQIYLEAWQLEQELGPDAFQREANQQALQTSFANLDEFKAQIPKLIIENNIHGVDIDPRAVQIAGLSLWQRAQRAWQQQGVKPQQRPVIVKSNIVCAEPMPGDKDLLKEFTGKLHPPALGQLVEVIFDKMELAGEAGTLLKIEEEIQTAIDKARDQWETKKGSDSIGDLFQDELEAATPQHELGFDLYGIDNETFWDDAEQLILKALSDYADRAEFDTDQKRLFAEDAAKGFAFIDLCRKRFDVVLMNPPFGDSGAHVNSYLKKNYDSGRPDLYMCFILRSLSMLNKKGLHGSITSSTFLTLQFFKGLRTKLLGSELPLRLLVDLGSGVLDGATVETCCFVSEKSTRKGKILIVDLTDELRKEEILVKNISKMKYCKSELKNYIVSHDMLSSTPGSLIAYKIPEEILVLFKTNNPIDSKYAMQDCENSEIANVRQGLIPGDQFRFSRSPLEVSGDEVNWKWCAKGGEYSNFISKEDIKINWSNDGREIKAYAKQQYGGESRTIKNEGFFFKGGISFPRVSSIGLNARIMSNSFLFSDTGMAVIPIKKEYSFNILAYMNSDLASYICQLLHPGRKFEIAHISSLPINSFILQSEELRKISEIILKIEYIISTINPDQYSYQGPFWFMYYSNNTVFEGNEISISAIEEVLKNQFFKLNELVFEVFEIKGELKESVIKSGNILRKARSKSLEKLKALYSNSDSGFVTVDDRLIVEYYFRFAFLGKESISPSKYSEVNDLFLKSYCYDSLTNLILNERQLTPVSSSSFRKDVLSIDELRIDDFLNVIKKDFTPDYQVFIEDLCLSISWKQQLSKNNLFFDFHLKLSSFGGRSSPVYWPFQTPSGSYTLWVYYHRLNEQTLYTCINDFVEPKLAIVIADLNSLRSQSARSTEEEKELAQLTDLEAELKDFRDELLRLARFWKPNLNDGVQITAAPLWKLFQHKAWQKKLKETWNKLEEGDYDWAHLAGSIWPERVLRKCHQDRSLAIAHDVEDIFWHEVEIPIMRGKKPTGNTKIEWQPKALTESELTALVKQTVIDSK